MKFSWKLINTFINLNNIQLKKFEELLTLSGIEIEDIQYTKDRKDNIFNVSLTTNRKEILSTLSLAKEVGIILNKQLKILPVNLFTVGIQKNKVTDKSSRIVYASINKIKIHNIEVKDTPEWLRYYLKVHNMQTEDTIKNIQQYVKLKWGLKLYILNQNQLTDINHLFNINTSILKIDSLKLKANNNTNKLIIFVSSNSFNNNTTSNINVYEEYYFNAYIDTIKIISTIMKCTHGKSQHLYKIKENYFSNIVINKDEIDTILGPMNNEKFNNLSSKSIISSLKQLKLLPYYDKFLQKFSVRIPSTRKHDLQRKIDIIEEIGRINGFHRFVDKIPLSSRKGKISKISIKIKSIRNTLRQLGFHEVVNCCLIKNRLEQNIYNITINNPITQEQTELRNNIIQNLIDNYHNNSKQNNNTVEIFEIGKTFQKNALNKYIESISVGGLIHNSNFIRDNWSKTARYPDFFHIKGIIETILEKLNVQIIFQKINYEKNTNFTSRTQKLFDSQQQIGIYNIKNQELIGILGKLSPKYCKEIDKEKKKIYIFEINIQKLNKTIRLNNHLNYISRPYSNYPSVTRDISIKIRKNTNIKEVKDFLLKKQNLLIESIKVLNEYFNKQHKYKSISLRITYRSLNRTLNNKDIIEIDNHVNKTLLHFKSKT
uniref:phenylalanine--tRNA ligase n=1 Tax=Laurenciella marilzae TaxID=1413812 RepID=A0A1Z1M273_9FLOR|nr:Phenylalanine-tRNA ligase beta subunit [Laurenciella marilzae]ARW59884.1 Phenylalanine-tRNA ligase beta subunit [Laurenciella marilzae]